jgi:hypothetical protein
MIIDNYSATSPCSVSTEQNYLTNLTSFPVKSPPKINIRELKAQETVKLTSNYLYWYPLDTLFYFAGTTFMVCVDVYMDAGMCVIVICKV